jgi:3-methylfumaryl-CoA hydratase
VEEWIGRSETVEDTITATPVAALGATLDRPAGRPAAGTPLPPLWHWLYFLPLHRRSDIGEDGHARRGGFLPPVALPRRMWAGSQLTFHQPLRVGDAVERRSTIEDITEKSGRSGPLVFVRVRNEVRRRGEAALAITEHHDIVYREAPRPGEAPAPAQPAPAQASWRKQWKPDDVLLFRYSALTFNGHRIHYDRRYVTEVEGYPGLVVHGPFAQQCIFDLLRDSMPGRKIKSLAIRARAPLFDIAPFDVIGRPAPDGKGAELWTVTPQGTIAAQATATLA